MIGTGRPSRVERSGERPLVDVNHADDHGGQPRPLLASGRCEDVPTVLTDPAQPGTSRVALSDRVRGDQAEGPLFPQQVKRPTEEVRDEVRVAVRLVVKGLEPVEIAVAVAVDERVLARERRVPHERIEPRILAVEHLGKLDLPVERDDGVRPAAKVAHGCFQPVVPRHIVLRPLRREVIGQ